MCGKRRLRVPSRRYHHLQMIVTTADAIRRCGFVSTSKALNSVCVFAQIPPDKLQQSQSCDVTRRGTTSRSRLRFAAFQKMRRALRRRDRRQSPLPPQRVPQEVDAPIGVASALAASDARGRRERSRWVMSAVITEDTAAPPRFALPWPRAGTRSARAESPRCFGGC